MFKCFPVDSIFFYTHYCISPYHRWMNYARSHAHVVYGKLNFREVK